MTRTEWLYSSWRHYWSFLLFTDYMRGAWSELLLGSICLSFILDGTGLVVIVLPGKCIFFQNEFSVQKVRREDRFYTHPVQNLKGNTEKKSTVIFGFWKLPTVYTELHYGDFGRNLIFVELRFLTIMTISEVYFRECHLSGKMSFSKLQYSVLMLGLNNKDSKVLSWPSKDTVNPLWGI